MLLFPGILTAGAVGMLVWIQVARHGPAGGLPGFQSVFPWAGPPLDVQADLGPPYLTRKKG